MNNESTEKILKVVERTRERAKQAENEFDRASDYIQNMASRSIDLFGGTAVSQVSDIAAESRKACDDLYASYQSLIMSIDSTCRPLITEDIEPSAVKAVLELIKWLNKESEIENNFTASLNNSSLGGVASGRYIPSIECKMIQNFWEDKYLDMPGVAEEIDRKRKEAEEMRLKSEQERKEKAEEHKKAMEEYEKKLHLWEEECDEIEQIRKKKLEEEVSLERKRVEEITEHKYNSIVEKLHKEIDETNNTITAATNLLASLGFFAFGEKSKQKQIIKDGSIELETLKQKVNTAKAEYSKMQKNDKKYIADFKEKIQVEIEKEHPMPVKPIRPKKVLVPKVGNGMTPVQSMNEAIKEEIVEFLSLETNRLYTVEELMADCDALDGCSLPKATALVTILCREGKLERIEEKQRAYFRVSR